MSLSAKGCVRHEIDPDLAGNLLASCIYLCEVEPAKSGGYCLRYFWIWSGTAPDSSHIAQPLLRETGPCSSFSCFQLSRLPLLRFMFISYKQISTKTSQESQVPLLGFFPTSNNQPSTGTRSSAMPRHGAALTELAVIRARHLKILAFLMWVIPSSCSIILVKLYTI